MDINILVADDDKIFRELICDIIKKQEYNVVEASDGEDALDIFFNNKNIDLIILDVMMPKCDGWEVLKGIREHSDVLVMMLTALGDEKHEVLGLKKGADDYISKPFSYEVFVARINRLLRKVIKERNSDIRIKDIIINQSSREVTVGNNLIELTNKEYSLLLYLLRNKNIVLSREKILDNIWGYDFEGDIRTIDTHVKTLRAKLLSSGKYIKTVRGSGYMLEVDANEDY